MQPDQFRQIAGQWLTGVAVVTAMESTGEPCGMTMSSVTSLSLEPPMFLICMDQRARSLAAIQHSGSFCINYLGEGQRDIAVSFSRPGEDRFGAVAFSPGETGSPVIDGVIAYVECRLHAIHPGGDHCIVIGDAVSGAFQGGRPLGYFSGRYRKLADMA